MQDVRSVTWSGTVEIDEDGIYIASWDVDVVIEYGGGMADWWVSDLAFDTYLDRKSYKLDATDQRVFRIPILKEAVTKIKLALSPGGSYAGVVRDLIDANEQDIRDYDGADEAYAEAVASELEAGA